MLGDILSTLDCISLDLVDLVNLEDLTLTEKSTNKKQKVLKSIKKISCISLNETGINIELKKIFPSTVFFNINYTIR